MSQDDQILKLELVPKVKLNGVSSYLRWLRRILLISMTKVFMGYVLGNVERIDG